MRSSNLYKISQEFCNYMESCRSYGFSALTGCWIQLYSIHIYTKRNLHNRTFLGCSTTPLPSPVSIVEWFMSWLLQLFNNGHEGDNIITLIAEWKIILEYKLNRCQVKCGKFYGWCSYILQYPSFYKKSQTLHLLIGQKLTTNLLLVHSN